MSAAVAFSPVGSGGLVRGSAGEVRLRDILPAHMRDCSGRVRQEPYARSYEAQYPGVVVVCDWEIIDDTDIAAMAPAQREQALEDRAALIARRAAAAKVIPPTAPTQGGDPERLQRELTRALTELASLEIDHPRYSELFDAAVTHINKLEHGLGRVKLSTFEKGKLIRRRTDAISSENQTKMNVYSNAPRDKRLKSIELGADHVLLRLLFDVEPDRELQDKIILKLNEMGKLA